MLGPASDFISLALDPRYISVGRLRRALRIVLASRAHRKGFPFLIDQDIDIIIDGTCCENDSELLSHYDLHFLAGSDISGGESNDRRFIQSRGSFCNLPHTIS
mmetsp:Transcript_4006/g.6146  ORF Transcript_4006/g.6146 Transcript_4006/m.6146 type:complete len:103 (-) Transcript_4006:262-570(-)